MYHFMLVKWALPVEHFTTLLTLQWSLPCKNCQNVIVKNKKNEIIYIENNNLGLLSKMQIYTGGLICDIDILIDLKQKRSTEGCSKFKSPETRQVQEKLVLTLEDDGMVKFLTWDAGDK